MQLFFAHCFDFAENFASTNVLSGVLDIAESDSDIDSTESKCFLKLQTLFFPFKRGSVTKVLALVEE